LFRCPLPFERLQASNSHITKYTHTIPMTFIKKSSGESQNVDVQEELESSGFIC